ncbi:MAG: hypothetical protein R3C03_08295 [Pirellulaceae bacterium]
MNEETFESEFDQQLRDVAVPGDLKSQLLKIPEESSPPILTTNTDSPFGSYRQAAWAVAIAASMIGVAILGWRLAGQPNDSNGVAADVRSMPVDSQSNETAEPDWSRVLAELESLKAQMATIKDQMDSLEIAELETHLARKSKLREAESTFFATEFPAAVIVSSAETSITSGQIGPSIRSQLEHVIRSYPNSKSAEDAKVLIAQL